MNHGWRYAHVPPFLATSMRSASLVAVYRTSSEPVEPCLVNKTGIGSGVRCFVISAATCRCRKHTR
ncbi:hypothetical protein U1Q18_022511 [Sarracenia purpurea var. burkii]